MTDASPGIATDRPADGLAGDRTLRARAHAILREAILDGRFGPGEKLGERELGALTGASRSILREALVHLEASGLIERESYKGFRVAALDPRKVREIFELRAALEGHAAELFAERASEAEIAGIEAVFARIAALAASGGASDLAALRAAKERYFELVFTGCRNVEIRRALVPVIDRIHFLRSRLIADPVRRARSLPELARLTRALAARDPAEARAAALAHLDGAREAALALLRAHAARRAGPVTAPGAGT